MHGRVDAAYRDELVERFDLDPSKKVRAYSKGNRQKVILIAALMARPDLLVLDEPTSGLDPLMEQAFRHCIAEAKDRGQTVFLVVAHPERGRGALRPGRHPPRRDAGRDGDAGRDAPPVGPDRRGDVRRVGPRPLRRRRVSAVEVDGRVVRCHVQGSRRAAAEGAGRRRGHASCLSREPSLEELFLARYGADGTRPDERAVPADSSCRRRPSSGPARVGGRRTDGPPGGPVRALCGATSSGSSWRRRPQLLDDLQDRQTDATHLAAALARTTPAGALFGPALQLQTVAGFTVFKTSMTLMILGAVWGLLTSTRLLRGEEDAGRWELLLARADARDGEPPSRRSAGLAAGLLTLWAITALITSSSAVRPESISPPGRRSTSPSRWWRRAVMFLGRWRRSPASSAATRRQAAAYAVPLLGVSYAARMVADSGTGLHWLLWISPLGWVEQLQPLTAPRAARLASHRRLHGPGGGSRGAPRGKARRRREHAARPDHERTRTCACCPAARGLADPHAAAGRRRLVGGDRRHRPALRADGQGGRSHDLGVVSARGLPRLGAPGGGHEGVSRRGVPHLAVLVGFDSRRPDHGSPRRGVRGPPRSPARPAARPGRRGSEAGSSSQ